MQTESTDNAEILLIPSEVIGDAVAANEISVSGNSIAPVGESVAFVEAFVPAPVKAPKAPKAPKAKTEATPVNSAISRVLTSLANDAKELEGALAEAATAAEALRVENAELNAQIEELAGVSSAKIEAALAYAAASDIRETLRQGDNSKAISWMVEKGWFVAESLPGIGARWSKDMQKFGTSNFAHAVELEYAATADLYRKAK